MPMQTRVYSNYSSNYSKHINHPSHKGSCMVRSWSLKKRLLQKERAIRTIYSLFLFYKAGTTISHAPMNKIIFLLTVICFLACTQGKRHVYDKKDIIIESCLDGTYMEIYCDDSLIFSDTVRVSAELTNIPPQYE